MNKQLFNKAIVITIFVKFIISGFFSSGYVDQLFTPFVNHFSIHGYNSWELSNIVFPYPPLMALVLYIPVKLSSYTDITYLNNLLFHIPILIADLLIFLYLLKLLPKNTKRVYFYYLLSPIVFYSSFIHTQLDLIPTCFIFISSYYLVKNKNFLSYFLLGISIAVKWHTAVAIPFYMIYSWKKEHQSFSFTKFVPLAFLPITISLLPFGSLESMLQVFKVNQGNLIFQSFFNIMDLKIYLFPIFYFLSLGATMAFKKINSELFFGIMAIVFMTFVIVVYPNPGWFVWFLPFLCYSFIKNHAQKVMAFALYSVISASYVIFFIFFYKNPFNTYTNFTVLGTEINWTIESPKVQSFIFTFLVSVICIGVYVVYKSAIKNSLLFRRKFEAFLIGIAGDSGAGKSTLLNSLNGVIESNLTTQLEGDAEHKWARGDRNWNEITHLNPKANELHRQLEHIIRLKRGHSTKRSNYNHSTGQFDEKKIINPNEFIVIAGLHPFYLKGARENIDLKIFLDTDETLRKNWKVIRDREHRGYSMDRVLKQLKDRENDSIKFIRPQMNFADLIIRYIPKYDIKIGEKNIPEKDLIIEYEVDIDIPIDRYVFLLHNLGCKIIKHEYADDLLKQIIRVDFSEDVKVDAFQSEYQDFFDSFNINNIKWDQGLSGLNQSMILHCIKEKYTGVQLNEV